MGVPSLDIAVVGCGSAGAAAALFLARAGHAVELLERAPAIAPVGAGLLMQPGGVAVLRALELDARVRARGAPIERLRSVTSSGRTLVDLHYESLGGGARGIGLHRSLLIDALVGGLDDAGVEVRRDASVAGIEREGGKTRLRMGVGTRVGPFDLVVVADGARSTLRRTVGIPFSVREYSWGALWAVLPDRESRFGGELFQVVEGTHTMLGVLPTGRSSDPNSPPLTSLFWSLPLADYEGWRQAGLAPWKARIAELLPQLDPLLAAIERTDDVTLASYHDVVMKRPYCDDAVVIGDAAHAMSPQLGQGANLGLVDALELARAFADCDRLPDALRRYHQRRRATLRFYQHATRWLTPWFQSSTGALGALRDVAFPLLTAFPPTRNQMTRTMAGLKRGLLRRSYPIGDPA